MFNLLKNYKGKYFICIHMIILLFYKFSNPLPHIRSPRGLLLSPKKNSIEVKAKMVRRIFKVFMSFTKDFWRYFQMLAQLDRSQLSCGLKIEKFYQFQHKNSKKNLENFEVFLEKLGGFEYVKRVASPRGKDVINFLLFCHYYFVQLDKR